MAVSAQGKFEKQARLSLILAVVAGLAATGVIVLFMRNFDQEVGRIVFGRGGSFILGVVGGLGAAMIASAAGFFLGLNSAGQKRNTASKLSWTSFFLNATMIALTLSLAVVFYLLRMDVAPTQS
jgi:hypothetical protein